MDKVTHDMLDEFGPYMKGAYSLMYPTGLTMEQLEQKAKEYNWLRLIYERFKEAE